MSDHDARHHELKCWPEYFGAVASGAKRFEIRVNDRGFDVGHRVTLREWEPGTAAYTGRSATYRIGYITRWDQKPGRIVFSLEPVPEPPAPGTVDVEALAAAVFTQLHCECGVRVYSEDAGNLARSIIREALTRVQGGKERV
jgi:hypothetical protein